MTSLSILLYCCLLSFIELLKTLIVLPSLSIFISVPVFSLINCRSLCCVFN
nr:MAG TPA: hypothetical protein [Caudoviricetes sp.]